MTLLLATLLLLSAEDSFTRFSYCHDSVRGPYESQCVQLGPDGVGEYRAKRREGNDVRADLALTPAARDRFRALLARTDFLARATQYESARKVADLGPKHLTVDLPSGRREATFNYSTLKEITDLSTFFEGLIVQESFVMEMDVALQYDRLRIPELLEHLEDLLKASDVADPAGLAAVLEKVENDRRVLDYARSQAGKIRQRLLK
jgi:hypothetical protein